MMRRIAFCFGFALLAGLGADADASNLAPTSLRALATGGGNAASAEGSEALFENPAALGLIGADVGLMPGEVRQSLHLELSTGVNVRNVHTMGDEVLEHRKSLGESNVDTLLKKDPSLFNSLWDLDRQNFGVHPEVQLSCATGKFAVSGWVLGDLGFLMHHNDIIPSLYASDTAAAGVQLGFSQALVRNELWVGVATKLIYAGSYNLVIADSTADSVTKNLQDKLTNFHWSAGADVGVLWLPLTTLRLGTSFRDLGMKYQGDYVVPEWDMGVAWFPQSEQSFGTWPRKFSLSAGLNDLLDVHHNWKLLSKISLGAQYEISPLPVRLLNFRFATGVLGGYPTAGVGMDLFRVIHLDAATWAYETGYYTGQMPDRQWGVRLAIGW